MKIDNIQGKKYNQLTVISFFEFRGVGGHAYWKVKCDCGKEKVIRGSHLRSMRIISCGCYSRKVSSILLKKYTNRPSYLKEGNPAWKGSNASVGSIHSWLHRNYKDKGSCTHCGENKKPRDWALIIGKEYAHEIKNFIPLCRSCHLKYDYTDKRRAKAKIILKKALKIRYENKSK